jgi:hypothetical protein
MLSQLVLYHFRTVDFLVVAKGSVGGAVIMKSKEDGWRRAVAGASVSVQTLSFSYC